MKLADGKLVRFLLVGAVNTAAGSALMFGLYNLAHWPYWPATAANVVLTSVLSFFLNKYFTFRDHGRSAPQAVRFAVNIAVCYLIAYGAAEPACLRLFAGLGGRLRGNISMLAGMCLFTGLNYLGQRLFAFRNPER